MPTGADRGQTSKTHQFDRGEIAKKPNHKPHPSTSSTRKPRAPPRHITLLLLFIISHVPRGTPKIRLFYRVYTCNKRHHQGRQSYSRAHQRKHRARARKVKKRRRRAVTTLQPFFFARHPWRCGSPRRLARARTVPRVESRARGV
jgi:hypothetical protein